MVDAAQPTIVEQGRAALARHEWRGAFDLLTAADARTPLPPDGLELLAQSAWWTGQLPLAIEARERAYAAAIKSGDTEAAFIAAVSLARDHLFRLSTTVANGWLNRAEKLLEGTPENPGHGWLAGARSFYLVLTGDLDGALEFGTRARDIGSRTGDRNLEMFGMGEMGATLLSRGEVEEGLRLADDAVATAVSGELEPFTAGGVCCATIEAFASIGDHRRAAEWTEAQDRWCKREGINGYPGMCRLFRSDVKRLHGAWPEAEAEARLASTELVGFIPAAAGLALILMAQIRMRRGDLPAAEEALLAAHGYGQDTEPHLSLLRLAQGRIEDASDSIRRALTGPPRPSWKAPGGSDMARLQLLPAQIEIALAARDVAAARTAAEELTGLAARFDTLPTRASARTWAGAVELAEGSAQQAVASLSEAVAAWTELDAPYELARARMLLADAYAAEGAADRAAIEVRTAHDAFERLGATPDQRAADARLAALQSAPGAHAAPVGTATQRTVRTFLFTDIVDSTRFAELLGDEAWDKLLRWHDGIVRSAAAEQGGEEVKATGDGFFLAFAHADAAIEAAIAIQRRLAAQRDAQGFAPAVRIGLHTAEANRVGLDYVGSGVNQAARVGGAAASGEILVTAASLEGVRHAFVLGPQRTLELKGITSPVEVVPVDWR
jgi:class 3 adenylate cyclase